MIFFHLLLLAIIICVIRSHPIRSEPPPWPEVVTPHFYYTFNVPGVLEESSDIHKTRSPYWWLNSGGQLVIAQGKGRTLHGPYAQSPFWEKKYGASNPVDTDNGVYPQNVFRLVTLSTWKDFRQEVYFKVDRDNLTRSPNRNASNGLLIMSRYQDGDNLYYMGIRVDGQAIIKKKTDGRYTTLAQVKYFEGSPYHAMNNPNLIPKHSWIGIAGEVVNTASSTVRLTLFIDPERTGVWRRILEVQDSGTISRPILNEGYAGIRTDFMDVEFIGYRASEITKMSE